ncbi:DNA-binding transcriptional regulator, MarR family [Methylobacterium sp. 174MFSha1.1]|uniref:MarR family winged helix-turn-helix transcriptional regulator n=1 Tax=Methylobacterium sp. 174MFSha1.1 TaxID=1502749 RepID=UPI0008E4F54B|nr:MarR family winged helix-turn-helix transcriptional regulator [Methylobacterium sp. 174MFSha1.1]SFU48291.1 DNA-binding transcriptional regulator, MarR family [Methylobacterium sp. 174MFSha1.1]
MTTGRAGRAGDQAAGTAPGSRLDLDRYVPALLTFVANKLSHSASATYQRRFGVNVTEWRIMSLLAIEPGIPAARICQVIGFDKGPVSRTLASMETRDLVATAEDPDDARRRLIRLTPRGEALHDEIIVVALEREQRLLGCLTPEQRDTLIDLLNRLHANLPAVTTSGPSKRKGRG